MSEIKTKPRTEIPTDIEKSLHEIIDYLWEDEHKHFLTFGGNWHGHIFIHLICVRRWLEREKK